MIASSTSSGLVRPIFRLNRSTDSVRIWLIFTKGDLVENKLAGKKLVRAAL